MTTKEQTVSLSSTLNTKKMQQEHQNQCPLILLSPLFQRISQTPDQDKKMANQCFKIHLKGTWFHISNSTFRSLFFSKKLLIFSIFCEGSYIFHLGREYFKILVFRLLENTFASQKIVSRHFYSCSPPGKALLQVFITTPPCRRKLLTPSLQSSIFSNLSHQQKGERKLWAYFRCRPDIHLAKYLIQ